MNPTFSTFPSKRLPCPCLSSTTLVRMIFIHFAGCEWTSLFVNIVIRGILKVAFSPNSFREQNVRWNWIGDEILVFLPRFLGSAWCGKTIILGSCVHPPICIWWDFSSKLEKLFNWILSCGENHRRWKIKICFKTCRSIIWILIFLIIQQFGLVLCKVSKAV